MITSITWDIVLTEPGERKPKMELSFSNIKDMVDEDKESQYGKFIDLEMLIEKLSQQKPEMETEETVLRFLYELSKIY